MYSTVDVVMWWLGARRRSELKLIETEIVGAEWVVGKIRKQLSTYLTGVEAESLASCDNDKALVDALRERARSLAEPLWDQLTEAEWRSIDTSYVVWQKMFIALYLWGNWEVCVGKRKQDPLFSFESFTPRALPHLYCTVELLSHVSRLCSTRRSTRTRFKPKFKSRQNKLRKEN